MVFDLGGGTLDVTIVEFDPTANKYFIKAKEGDLKLGGNDWDKVLADTVLKKAGVSKDFSSALERAEFQSKITRLKHELSIANKSMYVFEHNASFKAGELSRSEFETASKGLLDRAIKVARDALNSYSNGGVSGIDKIVLVGGSCNMPMIRNRLLSEFSALGESRIVMYDPSRAIAKGAAIYSKLCSQNRGGTVAGANTSTGIQSGTIVNCVSHTYGFGSRRSSDKKNMIYNVLYKGTEIPSTGKLVAEANSSFIAQEDDQTQVTFTVYESNGAKNSDDEDDENWMDYGNGEDRNGMSVTVNIPVEYHGNARAYSLFATFTLDQNEILELIIKDEDQNQIGYTKKQL